MEGASLNAADFERVMAPIFATNDFEESDFDRISRLLAQSGQLEWSYRPRTYTVLRLINRVDLLDSFCAAGMIDLSFPYSLDRLPPAMNDPSTRISFIKQQPFVLSKARWLERSDGRHRHFHQSADVHFESLRLLGTGNSGEVYHVRSKLSREDYALKRIIRKKLFSSKEKTQMVEFENEISSLKRLTHHHLVQLVGSYTDPKYIAMLISPVAECDLKDFLQRVPFPSGDFPLLRTFYGCICSAVNYLHNERCRHKDIKPENILIKSQRIYLTDFGTAKDWSDNSRSVTTGQPNMWTPSYAAPEIFDWDDRGSSADIWSLGCVFLDMTTILLGQSLDNKTTFFEKRGTGSRHVARNPQALALWLEQLPARTGHDQMISWIRQMLIVDRNYRKSASSLHSEILGHVGTFVYYGSCCYAGEETDDNTSYQGTISEPDDDIVTALSSGPQPTAEDESIPDGNESPRWYTFDKYYCLFISCDHISKPGPCLDHLEFSHCVRYHNANSLEETLFDLPATPRGIICDGSAARSKMSEADYRMIGTRHFNATKALALAWDTNDSNLADFILIVETPDVHHHLYRDGLTAMHLAAENDYRSTIKLLLQKGLHVDCQDIQGRTPLFHAARMGKWIAVEFLISNGADAAATNYLGHTALGFAILGGDRSAVLTLIQHGADIHRPLGPEKIAPLKMAEIYDLHDIAQLLRDHGAQ